MARKAVFLDRDGVINAYVTDPEFGTVDSPRRPEDFVLLPGAAEAIAKLKGEGFLTVVVSNQPGVAKGQFSAAQLEAVMEKMRKSVRGGGEELDAVYSCPHHPQGTVEGYRGSCECRKPQPGLLQQAAREWDIDLSRSYMVGDGIVDIQAGQCAGTRTILLSARKCYICSQYAERQVWPDCVTQNLLEAVEVIREIENGRRALPARGGGQTCLWEEEAPCYAAQYLEEAVAILRRIDCQAIEAVASLLAELRARGGRLFILGVGGGAGHASHAVCDFRKIAQIEAYSPADNASELTARVNDDGWETVYVNWLRGSCLREQDAVLVFSVGGGSIERNISANLVRALEYAKQVGAKVCGVVGRDGGYTARVADACVVVPVVNAATVTPHTEAFQALVWHLLVSHPRLKAAEMKWESVQPDPAAQADAVKVVP
jgi:D-sedoheptulose 7-phosphate isomerase